MDLERRALLLEAERARLFDHNGNRGTEAELSILRWLRARFAPAYTASSGEVIDSFEARPNVRSRQQDGILHRDHTEVNRFLLPSGMRLVPVETVAAIVEVKLSLTKAEFDQSDLAATETAGLRLRAGTLSNIPTAMAPGSMRSRNLINDEHEGGVSLNALGPFAPLFAIFAFGGPKEVETIASWLRTAKTIRLVACLEAGCALRSADATPTGGITFVTQQEDVLSHFAESIRAAIAHHENLWQTFQPSFSGYAAHETALKFWDHTTSYEHPEWYQPTREELATREKLYARRPKLRSKT